MIPMKKILVPIDFSDHSARALDYALELAQRFEGNVHLLHSYPIHVGRIAPYGMVVPESFDQECREAAEQHLEQWVERIAAQGIAVETTVTATLASEAIVQCAGEIEADLIVMGTRGLTGLAHVLLGSVAERTIRLAPCPVLTVKDATTE